MTTEVERRLRALVVYAEEHRDRVKLIADEPMGNIGVYFGERGRFTASVTFGRASNLTIASASQGTVLWHGKIELGNMDHLRLITLARRRAYDEEDAEKAAMLKAADEALGL